ncbi:protein FAM13A-like isoform X2 [Patiria miniata]|uniref:Rho-GAP domain-containing protein n=1 Tax=Patiria miniata TaxID=46514 RepID=A0A914ABR1_PATMI|nr:protein FAM13A-like isoform X2 [Patiria miniata]
MRPVLCGATNTVDSNTPRQGLESTEDGTMQKILRSPVTMKKKLNSKTFGVPLKELSRGPKGVRVPVFIRKICDFIQMHGIGHEGIFRINGSTRVVEKMKAVIDKMGDVDLEEAGDVMAVASLLKLFLRELPDPVMTETLHHKFINTQLASQSNPDDCIQQLKTLLQDLPEEHYIVLRYLIRFLVMVSQYEATNKMNSNALAIVFGPNLFRCSLGLDGLREQGITNNIVRLLIDEYDTIFKSDEKDEVSPPPAPTSGSKCIQVQATNSKRSPPVKPVPYQDYIRQKDAKKKKGLEDLRDVNSNSLTDTNREELKKADDVRDCESPAGGLLSPRDVSGFEERAFSPFNLDSETGTSTAPSPVINDLTSELVEKTIQETVSQHLFGQSPSLDRDESLTSPSPEVPVPSPRRRWQKKHESETESKDIDNGVDSPDGQSTSSVEEIYPTVRDRIRSFSSSAPDNKSPESSPKVKRKHQPSSRAFDMFETQGIVIGPAPGESPVTKKKQPTASAIPVIVEDPKRDRTNSRSPPSRRKAPEPPSRPSRGKSYLLKSKGHEQRSQESGSPGSGSPKSKSPRSNSPRSNSPRSNSPRSTSSRSNSPKTYSTKSDSPKSRSPRSKSPKSQSPKPISLRNSRLSSKDKPSHQPVSDPLVTGIHADFDSLSCNSPTLKSLTAGRVAPPKNRRSPSKRKSRTPEPESVLRPEEGSRPFTEQLSIIIPGTEPPGEGIDTPQDTPQPKPRKKHFNGEPAMLGVEPSQGVSGGLEALMNGGKDVAKSPPRSPQRREHTVPPLNLTSLHEHTDGEEPIPAWKSRHFQDGNQEAMLSPRSLKLQTITHLAGHQEAPPSPRARDIPFSFNSVSHDTDVPPSPPSAQPILTCVSKRADKHPEENDMTSVKQLTKQIRTLKRKIRQYEEEFEDEHGYKPSHIHKTSQPQIKKMMGDLKRANKQLKEAKENAAKAKVPLSNTLPAKMVGRNLKKQFEEATVMTNMEIALEETETRLQEKRDEANRPEDINNMNKEEVQEEKTAIQKALLQMENKFGRPSTKETKELMKPLYDRYRNVKKLLVRLELRQPEDGQPSSLDLQTIKENEETKEFQPKQMGQVHNFYSEMGEAEEEEMQTTDFTVTQDMRGILSNVDLEDSYPSPADSRRSSSGGREEPTPIPEAASNLHEASLSELLAMQNQSKEDKKRLRKVLKEFEDNFLKESGRSVQKEDRVPMETQYNEYKHVKKHLKLLEALVAKHRTQASDPPEQLILADL